MFILISQENDDFLTMKYQGVRLEQCEAQFLLALEIIIGEKIPNLELNDYLQARFGFVAKNNRVVCLGLRNKDLLFLPKAIENLNELEILDLSGNSLLGFSDAVKNLTNLKEVSFNGQVIQNFSNGHQNPFPVICKVIFDSKNKTTTNCFNQPKRQSHSNNTSNFRNDAPIDLKSKLQNILERAKRERNADKPQNKQSSIIYCDSCRSQNLILVKISLELVRKSPRKLVFKIPAVSMNCSDCNQKKEILNPMPSFLNQIPQIVEKLKSELKFHLRQNLYCQKCNLYYKDLECCPTHDTPLIAPQLVFIRGINQQYTSRFLLEKD